MTLHFDFSNVRTIEFGLGRDEDEERSELCTKSN
jgi:hypothetical protein